MNTLNKIYSIMSKFNNFVELKRNCGGKCREKNEISSSSFLLV